jgi:hypothetical protein
VGFTSLSFLSILLYPRRAFLDKIPLVFFSPILYPIKEKTKGERRHDAVCRNESLPEKRWVSYSLFRYFCFRPVIHLPVFLFAAMCAVLYPLSMYVDILFRKRRKT